MNRYFLLACVVALTACHTRESASHKVQPLKVQTMVVSPTTDCSSSRYVGTVEAAHAIPLSMQSTGRVVTIWAKNGQHVEKGQRLLAIDDTQARNALRTSKAALQHAQDGYDRTVKVHDKGVISDQKMVEIESQLAQAQALYDAACHQVEECTLVAPCEGVLHGLDLEKGQSVLPGKTLCTILDVTGFSVRFTVPEMEINRISVSGKGLRVTGEMECAAVDSTFAIEVTEKSSVANAVTHTYDVIARIEGGADILMPGMVGKVTVKGDGLQENGIVIPAHCILLMPQGHTVWVKKNDCAERRFITIDGYQADGVRVKDGLQIGDTVITEGYQKLYTGCKINVES